MTENDAGLVRLRHALAKSPRWLTGPETFSGTLVEVTFKDVSFKHRPGEQAVFCVFKLRDYKETVHVAHVLHSHNRPATVRRSATKLARTCASYSTRHRPSTTSN